MVFLKMGCRSLFRQKRRTLISLLVITLGMGSLLLATGHSRFIGWGLRESTIHSDTGHIQIFHGLFFEREENTILQYGLEDHEKIRSEISSLQDVRLVLARIDLMGLISNGEKSVACIGTGLEPHLEKKMRSFFGINSEVLDALISPEGEKELILLGNGLARSLSASAGDFVTLMTTTADGALNALDLKVAGTFEGFSPEYDTRAMMIPLETAQFLLGTDKVKKLVVLLDKTEKMDPVFFEISDHLEEMGFSAALRKWTDEASYYQKVKQFYSQITGFLSLVLFIIVFFSTSNTVAMAVVERTTEIGTMLSLGTSRWQTLKAFFFEGSLVGLVGGVFSMLFSYTFSSLVNSFNIVLPPPPGLTSGYPLLIRNEWDFYIQVLLAVVLVTGASSFFSALRATRMKIVDALGHV